MSGAIPLLSLYAFMVWMGKTLLFTLLYNICPQTVSSQGAVSTFTQSQFFKSLPVGTLKSPSVFSSN
jgi:hypothetical protein